MRALLVLLVLLFGSPALAKDKPPSASEPGPVRVYVWERGGLTGLYCVTAKAGLATGDACAFSPRLAVQLGGRRIVVARKVVTREHLEGPTTKLASYRFFAGIKRAPILVVESNAGMSVWAGDLVPELGPNHEKLPIASPKLASDKSGVAMVGAATVAPVPPDAGKAPAIDGAITLQTEGKSRTWRTHSYTALVALGALDLDRDGKTELVLLGTDDGGGFVRVVELPADPNAEPEFTTHLGG